MAHGFLTPTPVTGESPLANFLQKKLEKAVEKEVKKLGKKILDYLKREPEKRPLPYRGKGVGRVEVTGPNNVKTGGGGLLGAGKDRPLLSGSKGGLVEKNPTNIDVKTGRRSLPPGGPRLGTTDPDIPGSSGSRKGGAYTTIPGVSGGGKGIADTNFINAKDGFNIDAIMAARKEGSITGKELRELKRKFDAQSASAGAPPISPDSGADIVAAVNKNTQMIINLVDATKDQTKNDSNLVEKQIQAQDTMMSRASARAEEKALEQGSDLSGFMTPENFAKKKQQEAKKETGSKLKEIIRGPNPFKQECCMGGGGGIGDIIGGAPGGGRPRGGGGRRGGLPIPDFVRQKGMMPGGVLRRGGGRALTRGAAMVGGKAAAKGVAKGLGKMGLKKIPGVGAVAGAAFAAERAMKGDWLGAGGELLSGLAGTIPGIGTGVSAAIDAGLMARDAGLTPFARGGIVTQPTSGLVGEAGQEGVFPLEGKRGRDTFRMFGEGIFEAQKRAKQEYADLQSLGLKNYFETKGGFKIFGDVFKMMLGPLLGNLAGGLIDNIGNFANGLFGIGNNTPTGTMDTGGLASFIGGLESGNDYTKMVGGKQDASVLGKTIEELAKEKGDQFAMGRYQIQMRTARDVLKGAGIDSKTFKFDQAGQDKLFELLLQRRGLKDFQSGKITKEQFAKNLSMEWAALPQDASGKGYYDGVGTNKSLTSFSSVMGQLDALKSTGTPFQGSGSGGNLAAAAQSLKGMSTADGPDGGKNGCVYAVNKVFQRAGITPPWGSSLYVPDAEKSMIDAGWQQVPYGDMQPGDVFVMKDQKSPPQAHIGVATSNKMILSNSSGKASMSWEATAAGYNAYYGGRGTLYRMPGSQAVSTANSTPPGTPPPTKPDRSKFTGRSGAKAYKGAMEKYNAAMEAYNSQQSAPGPVAASPASANTGTPIMATSAQVARASASGGSPTVINNYYTTAGGSGGQVTPNGVSAGIGMDQTGLSAFQELKLRSLA